jgi:hypothetical protein
VFQFGTPFSVHLAAQRGNTSVLIDFRATTDDGQPVVDLKAEDISIKVDGKRSAVSSLRLVQNTRKAACTLPPRFATTMPSSSSTMNR